MTPQMRDTLDFIRSYTVEHGIAPSQQEIADGLGLASKSSIKRRLDGLEDRGVIKRLPYRTRSIEIVTKTCPHCGAEL